MLAALALTVTLALPAAGEWERIGVSDGVLLEKREQDGLWMRCTQRIDVPYEKARDTFLSLEFGKWVDSLSEWRVTERFENGANAYGRHKLPWPMADRDYVINMKWTDTGDKLLLKSVPTPDKLPLVKGVVRMKQLDDVWVLKRSKTKPGQTIIVYVYRGELGGNIPTFLEEAGMKAEGPHTFKALVKAMRE